MALDTELAWTELLRDLGKQPLDRIAAQHGMTEMGLIDALVARSELGDVHRQLWWPDAKRRLGSGESVRDVARLYRQPPDALRRALSIPDDGLGDDGLGDDGDYSTRTSAESPAARTSEMSIERRGRKRLVRPDEERQPKAAAPAPVAKERRKAKSSASPVRVVSPDDVDLSELMAPLKSMPKPEPAPVARPAAPSRKRPVQTRAPVRSGLPATSGPRTQGRVPTQKASRFAWEVRLASGKALVVQADDAMTALQRIAQDLSTSDLVAAQLRRLPLVG